MMLAEAPVRTDSRRLPDRATQYTTLYDLIATMHDVAPDADELITATIMDLLRSRCLRFLGSPEHVNEMIDAAEAA